MLGLILAVILGALFAYFALENSATTFVSLGNYVFALPLYIVALGSLLSGIILSWLLSLGTTISAATALSTKDNQIKKSQQLITDLKNRIHDLELQNTELLGETRGVQKTTQVNQQIAHDQAHLEGRPHEHINGLQAFFDRLRYRLAV